MFPLVDVLPQDKSYLKSQSNIFGIGGLQTANREGKKSNIKYIYYFSANEIQESEWRSGSVVGP